MATVGSSGTRRADRPRTRALPGPVRWCGRLLGWTVILASLAALGVAVILPRVAGATPYTILTGSMRPHLPPGTLVVDRPASHVGVGTIVTYQLHSGQPEVVTHRVVSVSHTLGGTTTYRTQGDANPTMDVRPVRPEQIRGVVWYAVPELGRINVLLDGHEHELLGYAAALGLAAYSIAMFGGAARDRRRRGLAGGLA